MLNKLTAEQILEILEANYSPDSFAFNSWTELIDKSIFKYSDELQQEIDRNNEAYKAYNQHPANNLPFKEKDANQELKQLREYWYSLPSTSERKNKEVLNFLGLGEIEEVEQYGGEGKGDEWYSVKHFKDHDVYIKIEGYYQSHNGTEFENGMGEEVKPVEKTITVYE